MFIEYLDAYWLVSAIYMFILAQRQNDNSTIREYENTTVRPTDVYHRGPHETVRHLQCNCRCRWSIPSPPTPWPRPLAQELEVSPLSHSLSFFMDTLFSLSDDTVTYDPMSFVKC